MRQAKCTPHQVFTYSGHEMSLLILPEFTHHDYRDTAHEASARTHRQRAVSPSMLSACRDILRFSSIDNDTFGESCKIFLLSPRFQRISLGTDSHARLNIIIIIYFEIITPIDGLIVSRLLRRAIYQPATMSAMTGFRKSDDTAGIFPILPELIAQTRPP